MKALNVLFAGGGTGGHLTPGLAVAAEVRRRSPDSGILFIGTAKELERRLVERAGFSYTAARSRPARRSLLGTPATAMSALASAWRANRASASFHPDIVVGLGGYGSAGPVIESIVRRRPLLRVVSLVVQ